MNEYNIKGERRDKKRQNRKKMKVSGKSVFTIQEITRKKADQIKEKRIENDFP